MDNVNHIRNGTVKLPKGSLRTWGNKTYCGEILKYAPTTVSKVYPNCKICVAGLIRKKEQELEVLKDWLEVSVDKDRIKP